MALRLNENGEWRYETVHHMGRRCIGWNYKGRCIYEITIVLANRASQALGRLLVRQRGSGEEPWLSVDEFRVKDIEADQVEARVEKTALGEAVWRHFRRMGEFTPEIRPLYCQIMPDHLHFIVDVTREMKRPLGNAIGGFKTGCEKIFAAQGGEGRLFAPGFVDEILFHEGQLDNWFDYLRQNPWRLAIKRLFPGLFRNVRELAVDLWLAPQTPDKGAGDVAAIGVAGAESVATEGVACSAQRAQARGWFSALGNLFLLKRPLAQIQVSRSFFAYRRVAKPGGGLKIARDERGEPIVAVETPDYRERRDALFALAKHGAVLLSPCVSDGERQIAREALAAGLKLVTMANKGFSKLQKPAGRYFDACAKGDLLMLAPAAWPYRPGEKAMTRFDATAMNRLCQWIAGPGQAEVNYHGLRPTNIDELAFSAAKVERI